MWHGRSVMSNCKEKDGKQTQPEWRMEISWNVSDITPDWKDDETPARDAPLLFSLWAQGGRLNARLGEKSAVEKKLKSAVLYANKIAGHARTAENANQ